MSQQRCIAVLLLLSLPSLFVTGFNLLQQPKPSRLDPSLTKRKAVFYQSQADAAKPSFWDSFVWQQPEVPTKQQQKKKTTVSNSSSSNYNHAAKAFETLETMWSVARQALEQPAPAQQTTHARARTFSLVTSSQSKRRTQPLESTTPSRSSSSNMSIKSTASQKQPRALARQGDWAAYLDETGTGLVYYYNAVTGASRWNPPTSSFPAVTTTRSSSSSVWSPKQPPQALCTSGSWSAYWDDRTNLVYYYNHDTQVSTWDAPFLFPTVTIPTTLRQKQTATSGPPKALATQGDWSAYATTTTSSSNTGSVYYFNRVTGKSQWNPPTRNFPAVTTATDATTAALPSLTRSLFSPLEQVLGGSEKNNHHKASSTATNNWWDGFMSDLLGMSSASASPKEPEPTKNAPFWESLFMKQQPAPTRLEPAAAKNTKQSSSSSLDPHFGMFAVPFMTAPSRRSMGPPPLPAAPLAAMAINMEQPSPFILSQTLFGALSTTTPLPLLVAPSVGDVWQWTQPVRSVVHQTTKLLCMAGVEYVAKSVSASLDATLQDTTNKKKNNNVASTSVRPAAKSVAVEELQPRVADKPEVGASTTVSEAVATQTLSFQSESTVMTENPTSEGIVAEAVLLEKPSPSGAVTLAEMVLSENPATVSALADPVVAQAVANMPHLVRWTQNDNGSITGIVRHTGLERFPLHSQITTSPVGAGARSNTIVETEYGSRYYLI